MKISSNGYSNLLNNFPEPEVNDINEDTPSFDLALFSVVPKGTAFDVTISGGEFIWHQYDAPDGSEPPASELFHAAYKKIYREWSFNTQQLLLFPASVTTLDAPINRKQILAEALEVAKTAPNVSKSNINGYQSDEFVSEVLAEFILDVLPTPVTNRKVQYSEIYMWLNINSTSNFNVPHSHVGGIENEPIWSGVYYLQVPVNSGDIVFYDPRGAALLGRKHAALYQTDSVAKIITPKDGQMLLFDPLLLHAVTTNNSEEERISIAFNVYGDVEE